MVGMLEQATNLARTLKESFCNIPTFEFVQDLMGFRAICYVNEDVPANKRAR